MTKEDKDCLSEEIVKKVFILKEEKSQEKSKNLQGRKYGRKATIF